MAQGTERRESVGSRLAAGSEVAPATAPAASGGFTPAQAGSLSSVAELGRAFGKFASKQLSDVADRQNARSTLDGKMAYQQGVAFESLETGGNKFALEGYRLMEAQTLASEMAASQERLIALRSHEESPEAFRQQYVEALDEQIAGLDPRTAQIVQDNMTKLMPGLVEKHTSANLAWKENKAYEAAGSAVLALSPRPGMEQAAMAIMTGAPGSPSSGLSEERRLAAVADGIVASLSNGDASALNLAQESGVLASPGMMKHMPAIQRGVAAINKQMGELAVEAWKADVAEGNVSLVLNGGASSIRERTYKDQNGNVQKLTEKSQRVAVTSTLVSEWEGEGLSHTDQAVKLRALGLASDADIRKWRATFAAGSTRIDPEAGVVPQESLAALDLYTSLSATPGLRKRHLGGEQVQDMYRMAAALQSDAGHTPEAALIMAKQVTDTIHTGGAVVKTRRADLTEAFDSLDKDNEGWFFGLTGNNDVSNMPYVRDTVTTLSRFYAQRGMNAEEAVKQATEDFTSSHYSINGAWINSRDRDVSAELVTAMEGYVKSKALVDQFPDEGTLSLVPMAGRADHWMLSTGSGMYAGWSTGGGVIILSSNDLLGMRAQAEAEERRAAQEAVEVRPPVDVRRGGPDTSAAPAPATPGSRRR